MGFCKPQFQWTVFKETLSGAVCCSPFRYFSVSEVFVCAKCGLFFGVVLNDSNFEYWLIKHQPFESTWAKFLSMLFSWGANEWMDSSGIFSRKKMTLSAPLLGSRSLWEMGSGLEKLKNLFRISNPVWARGQRVNCGLFVICHVCIHFGIKPAFFLDMKLGKQLLSDLTSVGAPGYTNSNNCQKTQNVTKYWQTVFYPICLFDTVLGVSISRTTAF